MEIFSLDLLPEPPSISVHELFELQSKMDFNNWDDDLHKNNLELITSTPVLCEFQSSLENKEISIQNSSFYDTYTTSIEPKTKGLYFIFLKQQVNLFFLYFVFIDSISYYT